MIAYINPIPAYPKPGIAVDAHIAADNLKDHAVFRWFIKDEDARVVGRGDLALQGDTYAAWDGTNDAAMAIILARVQAEPDLQATPAKVAELQAAITADAQADKAREEEIAQLEAEKAAAVLAAGQLAAEKADAEKAVAAKDAELAALKEKLGALTNALPSALTADDEPLAP